MIIRPETSADIPIIRAITEDAFRSQTEGAIIDALRRMNALILSLVAAIEGEIVGHVAFSPAHIDGRDVGYAALGPVAVRPDKQKSGIGDRLIREGLGRLKSLDFKGCVLLGSPAYYGRFGFRVHPGLCPANLPAMYFQALSFDGAIPTGTAAFHEGFDAKA
jgi:putative acetyltransferase